MTQLQASASAGQGPPDVSAQTANQASGASPAAVPVSVTATQTSVIPAPGSVETAGTTRQDTSVNIVQMGSLETRCLVQGSTVGPAPALVTPVQITLTASPVKQTTPRARSSVTADKATLGPAVTSVLLVIMETQSKAADSACHASVTATSTPRILGHVTPGPASALSACTTLMAHPVPTVSMVTMATRWLRTADVVPA